MTEQIDLSKSEQYTLSIRLCTDGFSFSIYTPLDGNALYYQTYTINSQHSMAANVKLFVGQTKEFGYKYRRINILVSTPRYTTVPLEFYKDSDAEDIYHQNLPKAGNDIILCNMLSRSNVAILFAIDKLSHLYLSEKFPEARFYAAISPITEELSSRSKQGNCRKIFANITSSCLDLLGFEKGNPIIINSFKTVNTDDICYYILNIWQQSNYDQNRDELHLYANTAVRREVSARLQEFIKHIYIINPKAEFSNVTLEDGEEIPFEIQSIITCE